MVLLSEVPEEYPEIKSKQLKVLQEHGRRLYYNSEFALVPENILRLWPKRAEKVNEQVRMEDKFYL